MLELKKHQKDAVKDFPNKWGMFFRQRCGKSPTAIRLACERVSSAIVISPKSIVDHWKREIDNWRIGDCNISVISRETFRRDWDKLPCIDAIIIDEVHAHFGNYKNRAYKALFSYIKKWSPPCIWLLSGTPLPSSSWAVYSYGLLLGKKWSWYEWDKKFFYKIKIGRRMISKAKDGMNNELQKILRSIGTVIDLKDVADVPDDEEVIETFTLNTEQKRLIKEHFDPLPIVRWTATHQLEQGVLKSDGYRETVSIPCEKDSRLMELVDSVDKIVIVCRYHDQINKIVDNFKNLGRNIYQIHGKTEQSAADIALEAENDPSAIVVSQGDTCVGYSLKSFNLMVFMSMSFSFVNFDQMKSRMKAMEKTTPCQYVYMITDGESVDRGVYEAVQRKQDFSIELFNNK